MKTSNAARTSEPTSGSLSFDKPIFPQQHNQQYAGLSLNTMNDAGSGAPAAAGEAPYDSVRSKGQKRNQDGGHTDTSERLSGTVDTTTFDKKDQAVKNRTDYPGGGFSEQTLNPKDNSVKVREQKANGDFSETNVTGDGKSTIKSHATNGDGGHTDSNTNAAGYTDATTVDKNGKLTGRRHENPDGSYSERKVGENGAITFHDQQKDGSYVETLTDKNGSAKTIHTVNQDGGSDTKQYDPSGKLIRDRNTQADQSFVEKTVNKDGTTTIHDQKSDGNFSEAYVNDKGEHVKPSIDVSNASPEFVKKVTGEIAKLPENVQHLLASNGTRITIANRISDLDPELANKRPPGHDEKSNWASMDGMQNSDYKRVVVAEFSSSGKSDRVEGVLRHEVGHAVDRALGRESAGPEFDAAYSKDVAAMSDSTKTANKYKIQPDEGGKPTDGGKGEAFADVFGALNGASCNPADTAKVLATYPNTAEYLRKKMSGIQ
jgi:hypothetical protein